MNERCILCSRCIRFCDEIIGESILGFTDRGSYSTLGVFPGKQLTSNYSLNTVDLCPVGALTSTDFRFKMRVWFLKETPSIDTESSVGCNTVVGSREGVIHRITPRRNDAVNDTWMPDSGRMLYKQVDSEDRLTEYRLDGKVCGADDALAAAQELLQSGSVAIVGSGRLSVEEQYLLRRIAGRLSGSVPVYLVARTADGDGMLISADRNPNVRGALVTGLIDSLPQATLPELAQAIDAGTVKTILTVGEDLTVAGISVEQLRKVAVINIHTHHSDTAQYSKVDMPLLTVFEKSGSFINQQFRVQKFAQAVPGPKGTLFGLSTFTRLYRVLTGEELCEPSADAVWHLMVNDIEEFKGLSFRGIPETGHLIDGKRFADLPFVEGKSLHYEPAAVATAQA
ncbi:MAG: molybdopterin-dependent oxidoreductase [Verrucomicrobia bacterium]|nr:molybdopterin-dependent oxidoreductase [Verrucomicrobiota bacterium]